MTEGRWAPLERLAERAPMPAPGLAESMLVRGQAARRRRAVGSTLVSAGSVAALVAGMVVLTGPPSTEPGPSTASPAAPSGEATDPEQTTASDHPALARLRIVVAGIERLVDDIGGPAPKRLLVSDQLCRRAVPGYRAGEAGCRPWTPVEQRRLTAMLSDIAPTRFVPADAATRRLPAGTLLVKGAALERPTARTGRVFVFAFVGFGEPFSGCQGGTYDVRRANGEWETTPASGPAFIC